MTLLKKVIEFEVVDGEILVAGAGWVYVWIVNQPARVIYVGATGLHPAARAEKHLRDPDADVGRIRGRYEAMGGNIAQSHTVKAIQLPSTARRGAVKFRVAWLLKEAEMLSPHYCGEPPEGGGEALSEEEEFWAQTLVSAMSNSAPLE